MQINSMRFVLFFAVCFAAYYAVPHRWRWAVLLAASYYFYLCWNVKYVVLLAVSTLVDYAVARGMEQARERRPKTLLLLLSLGCNLGILCWFKYFNFLSGSAQALVDTLGLSWRMPAMDVLLPVGISFYIFKTLSYVFDVYLGVRSAERHLGHYAAYVAFFPQLLAGPIARATHMLPQFCDTHRITYDNIALGGRLVLLGLFKKLVVADRLDIYVDGVYNNVHYYDGALTFWLATYFFAIQIYCDFSGYSDMAIGVSRLLGFDVPVNFRTPYFAQSTGEFWRRWHISLSTWFRDYLFIPLGGSRVALPRRCFNLMVVFLISGLWHGAAWTFVIWGGLHGLFLAAGVVRQQYWGAPAPGKLRSLLRILITFHLTAFAWIFFRANSLSDAAHVVRMLFSGSLGMPFLGNTSHFVYGLVGVADLFLLELFLQDAEPGERLGKAPLLPRWALYVAAALTILLIGVFDGGQFIYLQF